MSLPDDDVFFGARYQRLPRHACANRTRREALSASDQGLIADAWRRTVQVSVPPVAPSIVPRPRPTLEMQSAPDDSSSLYTLVAGVLIAVGVIAMLIVLSMIVHP